MVAEALVSNARDEILAAVRAGLADRPAPLPDQRETVPRPGSAVLLSQRLDDYGASVTELASVAEIAAAATAAARRHGARRIAIPGDLPAAWHPVGVELLVDDPPLPNVELAVVDATFGGSALAIAETGTIVLDGSTGQGRRALTLLPDLHICVVLARKVVADLPDAIASLAEVTRPLTFVSGPSASSDIELSRVEGVHGPRRLEVLLVADALAP